MDREKWLIGASDMQRSFFHRFVSKYNWTKFEYGCYLEYNNVTLILQISDDANELEVQLRQTGTYTLNDRIAANCFISLFEKGNYTFEQNLILTYVELNKALLDLSSHEDEVKNMLQSYFEYLKTNLNL